MAKNTSFILGDHFNEFIAAQVAAGRYAHATDVIRSGLRLLEERETKIEVMRRAIVDSREDRAPASPESSPADRRARELVGAGSR